MTSRKFPWRQRRRRWPVPGLLGSENYEWECRVRIGRDSCSQTSQKSFWPLWQPGNPGCPSNQGHSAKMSVSRASLQDPFQPFARFPLTKKSLNYYQLYDIFSNVKLINAFYLRILQEQSGQLNRKGHLKHVQPFPNRTENIPGRRKIPFFRQFLDKSIFPHPHIPRALTPYSGLTWSDIRNPVPFCVIKPSHFDETHVET